MRSTRELLAADAAAWRKLQIEQLRAGLAASHIRAATEARSRVLVHCLFAGMEHAMAGDERKIADALSQLRAEAGGLV